MEHYKPMILKDTSLRFRLESELHDQFLMICKIHGVSAAKVLREYMRAYVATHENKLEDRIGNEYSS